MTLAPQLLLIFCATIFLSIQQPQYLANGNVSKVTCFPEILAQMPKSLYHQCCQSQKYASPLQMCVCVCHTQDCLAALQVCVTLGTCDSSFDCWQPRCLHIIW